MIGIFFQVFMAGKNSLVYTISVQHTATAVKQGQNVQKTPLETERKRAIRR